MDRNYQFSSESEINRQFRQDFDSVMPSSRKPKQYESAGVLMLSFDHENTFNGVNNMDVREEVQLSHHLLFPDTDVRSPIGRAT